MVSTKNRLFWLIPVAAVLIAVIAGVALLGGGTDKKWQEQYDLGVRYLSELNYEAAILAFTEAIAIDENRADAYLSRAHAYVAAGSAEAALADYNQAITLDNTKTDAYMGRGDLYLSLADYEKAVADYTQAIEQNPDNLQAYLGRADAYLALGNKTAAMADLARAVELGADASDEAADLFAAQLVGLFHPSDDPISLLRQPLDPALVSLVEACAQRWPQVFAYEPGEGSARITVGSGHPALLSLSYRAEEDDGGSIGLRSIRIASAEGMPVRNIRTYFDGAEIEDYAEDGTYTETAYDANRQVESITYHRANNSRERQEHYENGQLQSVTLYDEQDRSVRHEAYEDGQLKQYDIYTYNAEGQKIQESRYDGQDQLEDITYYNDAGERTRMEFYSHGSLSSYVIIEPLPNGGSREYYYTAGGELMNMYEWA